MAVADGRIFERVARLVTWQDQAGSRRVVFRIRTDAETRIEKIREASK